MKPHTTVFIFSVLVFCIAPLFLTAQHRSTIDIVGGAAYSFRTLKTSSDEMQIPLILETRSSEIPNFSYRFGFNYNRRLSERIWLKTGLRWANIGYKGSKREGLRWPSEFDGQGGWQPDPSLAHEIQLIYYYQYVEIPVHIRMELSGKRLVPFIELGVSPHIYINNRTVTQTDVKKEASADRISDFNTLNLSASISLGLSYIINSSLQAFFQPTFRYHFTPLVKDALIEEYLYNYGVELGVRYALVKKR